MFFFIKNNKMPNGAKRWCFTINNPTIEDKFWCIDGDPDHPSDILANIQYLIVQEEQGKEGTVHYQGFLILKDRKTLEWLKRRINQRAHWEITKGTNQQAADYCKKSETATGRMKYEYGELPTRSELPKRDERIQQAAEELDVIKEVGYKRPNEIPSLTLMQCGFIPAMKELCADVLGPYRPNLKIITMIGPPGTGKSYATQHFFPDHARCIYANNGVWFQNPTAKVVLFEEFHGQIPLARMLEFLDVYPLALEIKGGMRPAMYETVVITSNTSPRFWYPQKEGVDDPRRQDAVHALWDRIGYSDGTYVPVRTMGHYLEAPSMMAAFGQSAQQYIAQTREFFWNSIVQIMGIDPIIDDDPA